MPKIHAILVGINYYDTASELQGCHNDVDLMFSYLRKCGVEDFKILKDSIGDEKHVKEDCPTKSNIIGAVKDAYAKMGEQDTLLFHYSGHGSQLRDKNHDEKDGQDECICPVDYAENGFLIDDDLNKLLVQPLLQNPELKKCKLRCIFDSCHSGSILDLPFTVLGRNSISAENKNREYCDAVCISGCRDPQTSADAQIGGKGQGAATFALWSALSSVRVHGSWMDVLLTMQQALKQGHFSQSACLSVPSVSLTGAVCDLVLPDGMKQQVAKKLAVQPVVASVDDMFALMRRTTSGKTNSRQTPEQAAQAASKQPSSVRGDSGRTSGNSGR